MLRLRRYTCRLIARHSLFDVHFPSVKIKSYCSYGPDVNCMTYTCAVHMYILYDNTYTCVCMPAFMPAKISESKRGMEIISERTHKTKVWCWAIAVSSVYVRVVCMAVCTHVCMYVCVCICVYVLYCIVWHVSMNVCMYSFIHTADLYSVSSRRYYSEALLAQSRPKKKDLRKM